MTSKFKMLWVKVVRCALLVVMFAAGLCAYMFTLSYVEGDGIYVPYQDVSEMGYPYYEE